MELHSDFTATVHCVDYGNTVRVRFSMLRKRDSVLQHFSMQAINIQIAYIELVKPVSEWSASEKWRFSQVMPRKGEFIVTETLNRKYCFKGVMVLVKDCQSYTDIWTELISLGFVRPVDASRPSHLSYKEGATACGDKLLKISPAMEPLGNKH